MNKILKTILLGAAIPFLVGAAGATNNPLATEQQVQNAAQQRIDRITLEIVTMKTAVVLPLTEIRESVTSSVKNAQRQRDASSIIANQTESSRDAIVSQIIKFKDEGEGEEVATLQIIASLYEVAMKVDSDAAAKDQVAYELALLNTINIAQNSLLKLEKISQEVFSQIDKDLTVLKAQQVKKHHWSLEEQKRLKHYITGDGKLQKLPALEAFPNLSLNELNLCVSSLKSQAQSQQNLVNKGNGAEQ